VTHFIDYSYTHVCSAGRSRWPCLVLCIYTYVNIFPRIYTCIHIYTLYTYKTLCGPAILRAHRDTNMHILRIHANTQIYIKHCMGVVTLLTPSDLNMYTYLYTYDVYTCVLFVLCVRIYTHYMYTYWAS